MKKKLLSLLLSLTACLGVALGATACGDSTDSSSSSQSNGDGMTAEKWANYLSTLDYTDYIFKASQRYYPNDSFTLYRDEIIEMRKDGNNVYVLQGFELTLEEGEDNRSFEERFEETIIYEQDGISIYYLRERNTENFLQIEEDEDEYFSEILMPMPYFDKLSQAIFNLLFDQYINATYDEQTKTYCVSIESATFSFELFEAQEEISWKNVEFVLQFSNEGLSSCTVTGETLGENPYDNSEEPTLIDIPFEYSVLFTDVTVTPPTTND